MRAAEYHNVSRTRLGLSILEVYYECVLRVYMVCIVLLWASIRDVPFDSLKKWSMASAKNVMCLEAIEEIV